MQCGAVFMVKFVRNVSSNHWVIATVKSTPQHETTDTNWLKTNKISRKSMAMASRRTQPNELTPRTNNKIIKVLTRSKDSKRNTFALVCQKHKFFFFLLLSHAIIFVSQISCSALLSNVRQWFSCRLLIDVFLCVFLFFAVSNKFKELWCQNFKWMNETKRMNCDIVNVTTNKHFSWIIKTEIAQKFSL